MISKCLCVLCCLLLAAGWGAAESQPSLNEAGQPLISDFTLPMADDGAFTLSEHRGERIILHFWASWCEYSTEEFPLFQQMQDHYPDLTFLMVDMADGVRETRASAQAFLQDGSYTLANAYDEDMSVFTLFPGNGELPMTVLIDADGYLADVVQGQIDPARLLQMTGQTANVQPAPQH